MNSAIIVAAGSGRRFGTQTPKQFLEINGKPLIIHTLEKFQACAEVGSIILVLPQRETSTFLSIVGRYGITKLTRVVAGGETRAESVQKGLAAIRPVNAEIVAVHDGARPLVTPGEIGECILKARESGAAILTAPVTDTIKVVRPDGTIEHTIDRNTLRRALTPQCFRYEIIMRAFESAGFTASATDESFLVEKAGFPVSVVEGSSRNIKVTTPEDLFLVERLLND